MECSYNNVATKELIVRPNSKNKDDLILYCARLFYNMLVCHHRPIGYFDNFAKCKVMGLGEGNDFGYTVSI